LQAIFLLAMFFLFAIMVLSKTEKAMEQDIANRFINAKMRELDPNEDHPHYALGACRFMIGHLLSMMPEDKKAEAIKSLEYQINWKQK
jgi:energy-converting hydrogenase Eha subunit H